MNQKGNRSLMHGIVNLIFPIAVVGIRQGVFGAADQGNPWDFFYMGILLAFIPIVSSAVGIIIANVRMKQSPEKKIRVGLALSWLGGILAVVFRFVLKL